MIHNPQYITVIASHMNACYVFSHFTESTLLRVSLKGQHLAPFNT